MAYLASFGNMLLLAFGFGFVIFWHELGHFLAAKWADVKVEQFAVGFGQALISWRKGLGFRWGSTQEDYQKQIKAHIDSRSPQLEFKEQISATEAQLSAAAAELKISETEYRLNWIPLGGYVKMLGQDDLKPGQTVADPRSYNNKTIGRRMVIVSAGVIMNVILAAIAFMYVFTVGLEVPKATVGVVVPGSPAMNTFKLVDGKQVPFPLQVGDQIQSLNGRWQSDFEKVKLNIALSDAGVTIPIDVVHADGTYDHLWITPAKSTPDAEFPQIGVDSYLTLEGPDLDAKDLAELGPQASGTVLMGKGEVITSIAGKPVKPDEYYKLAAAVQHAGGEPVDVEITGSDQKTRTAKVYPRFNDRFVADSLNFAGMEMPTRIQSIQPNSSLLDKDLPVKAEPGDLVVDIADPGTSGGHKAFPTRQALLDEVGAASSQSTVPTLSVTVRREDGKEYIIKAKPNVKLGNGKMGFGIEPVPAERTPIIAGVVKDSPAAIANVRPGSLIESINGKPVRTWFDVNNILSESKPGQPIEVVASLDGASTKYTLASGLTQTQIAELNSNRVFPFLPLKASQYSRKARGPVEAASWGVGETRDAILQVYQTVRSMKHGGVSVKQISGPLGILTAGYRIAEKGTTRLVWFLAIISANLAVMNFLPIPIVDGGLFTFLIIEKIKGSPISPRVQSVAQAVGLVLLLSVFVFATWQDVLRLPSMLR